MKTFILGADNRIVLCAQVHGIMVACGYMSMEVLIRSAAFRGGLAMRDQRQANF